MHVYMVIHKNNEASTRNLETQVDQLEKKLVDQLKDIFNVNTDESKRTL